MGSQSLYDFATFMTHAAERAGDAAMAHFNAPQAAEAKSSTADLVTPADKAAESILAAAIASEYPDDGICSEEGGLLSASQTGWTWHLDPLDGTHNFVLGIPLFGVAIVAALWGIPQVSMVRNSVTGSFALALGDRQVILSADIRACADAEQHAPPKGGIHAVSLQQGYAIPRASETLSCIRDTLESVSSRVLYTWAPTIDALMLVSGRIDAIVSVGCKGAEHVAARHIAENSGYTITDQTTLAPGGPLTTVIERSTTDNSSRSLVTTALAKIVPFNLPEQPLALA